MNHVVLLLMGLSAQLCCSVRLLDTRGAFKIVLQRVELVEVNTSLVDCKISLGKINRYKFAISAFVEFKEDLPLSTKITLQAYEFLSNEYRPFAIHFEKTLCSLMEMEYKYMFYPDMLKKGNNVPKPRCPVLKGNYSFTNYQPSEGNFPVALPLRYAMVDLKVSNAGVTIMEGRLYLELDRDAAIREQFSKDSPGK